MSVTQPSLYCQHRAVLHRAISRSAALLSEEALSALAQNLHQTDKLVDLDNDEYVDLRYSLTLVCWATMHQYATQEFGVEISPTSGLSNQDLVSS
jgi:hypothetical protein